MESTSSTYSTVSQAADRLGLTPQQVRNLCRSNKLDAERVGSFWLLKESEIEYYRQNHSCGNTVDRATQDELLTDENPRAPIALSFFSGAMGMDIGIERAGFKTLLACEVDKASRKTIAKNRPSIALIGDIRNYSSSEIRWQCGLSETDEIDLVVGGPPCQAFSTAGNRKGFEDERGNVFLTFLDRIIELRPKYAVIENVRGILSAPLKHRPHAERGEHDAELSLDEVKGGALLHILSILRAAGYGVSFNLYNSANFGTPQKRERVIIIASRDGRKLPYLTPTHSENGSHGLPKWRTFRDAVSDITAPHHHLKFPEKRLKYYQLLKAGENWKNLPVSVQQEAMGQSFHAGGGKTGFFRRLAWDEPSPTLVTHPAMPATDLCHPAENRPLSIEEYKRIQQFPDDWIIEGTLVEQYRQVGNAVPSGLGFAVGKLLMDDRLGVKSGEIPSFAYSRYRNTDEVSWEREARNAKESAVSLF